MKKVTCSMIVVVSVFVYGFALAAPNNPPSAPVTVVNTGDNPVPVTGSLGISGTADVNVTNTVPVTGNVNVTNTVPVTGNVNVTNTVPVTGNVNVTGTVAIDGMKETFIIEYDCEAVEDHVACTVGETFVPEGKRMIIEYFSCRSGDLVEGGSLTCAIRKKIATPGGYTVKVLHLPTSPTSTGPPSEISAGQSVKLYVEPPDGIDFLGYRNNNMDSDVVIAFSAIGYYEDVP